MFATFITHRQAAHYAALTEQLAPGDPGLAQAIAGHGAGLAGQITDAAARQAAAVQQIAQDAAAQAYVLAYNDAYFLTALIALGAAAALALHMLRDRLAARLGRSPRPDTNP